VGKPPRGFIRRSEKDHEEQQIKKGMAGAIPLEISESDNQDISLCAV
jgi:hypothetical protein